MKLTYIAGNPGEMKYTFISGLPNANPLNGNEYVPISQLVNGYYKTFKVTLDVLLQSVNIGEQIAVMPISGTSYSAVAVTGEQVYTIYNTSGLPYTFELPATPGNNQIITVVDASLTANTETITILGNGNTLCAYGSSESSIEIVSQGGSVRMAWDHTQWVQLS